MLQNALIQPRTTPGSSGTMPQGAQMAESPTTQYVLEIVPFDEDHLTSEVGHLSGDDIAACPTLAALREQFGADTGALTDPSGHEHLVVLSGPPRLHPRTRFLVDYHAVTAVTSGRD